MNEWLNTVVRVTGLICGFICRTPASSPSSTAATASTTAPRDCCAAAVVLHSPAPRLHGEEAVARDDEHLLDQLESHEDASDADGKLYCESFRAS